MTCTTEMDACPTGCGTHLVFLRPCKSPRIVLFCFSCEAVWDAGVLSGGDTDVFQSLKDFGSGGLRLLGLKEIEEAQSGGRIGAEFSEDEYPDYFMSTVEPFLDRPTQNSTRRR